MSQRDTIDGKTAAESILTQAVELVANMPEDSAFHARTALMQINRMVATLLFKPSNKPYHHRVLKVAFMCRQASQRDYLDSLERQVYEAAAETATDFYDAVMHHANMEAPLPF